MFFFTLTLHTGFVLNRGHLQPLLHSIGSSAAPKWRRIGTALNFTKGVLDTIAATHENMVGGPIDCFTDMLDRWLRWAPPKHSLPTLETLCGALREDTVGEERLAFELEQNFPRKMRCTPYWCICSFIHLPFYPHASFRHRVYGSSISSRTHHIKLFCPELWYTQFNVC